MLAGTEHEVAMFRRVNDYPHVIDKAILGSPDGLNERELHTRALVVMADIPSAALATALAEFERHKVSIDSSEISRAAAEARIADLFVSSSAGDLCNTMAIETIRNGGRAWVLSPDEMPAPSVEAAAILRY